MPFCYCGKKNKIVKQRFYSFPGLKQRNKCVKVLFSFVPGQFAPTVCLLKISYQSISTTERPFLREIINMSISPGTSPILLNLNTDSVSILTFCCLQVSDWEVYNQLGSSQATLRNQQLLIFHYLGR